MNLSNKPLTNKSAWGIATLTFLSLGWYPAGTFAGLLYLFGVYLAYQEQKNKNADD